MMCRGRVKNGGVHLDEPGALPEGAAVKVELVPEPHAPSTGTAVSRGREGFGREILHGIPVIYVLLLLIFLGGNYLFMLRHDMITECARVLLIEGVENTQDLEAKLAHLNPRKGPTRDSPHTEGAQAFNLIFPWPSALHLWVEFDPESREVLEHGLVYFASESVDLVTHEGAGSKPLNGLAFLLTLMTAVMIPLWYFAARRGRAVRYAVIALLALTLLPLGLFSLGMPLHFGFILLLK